MDGLDTLKTLNALNGRKMDTLNALNALNVLIHPTLNALNALINKHESDLFSPKGLHDCGLQVGVSFWFSVEQVLGAFGKYSGGYT